MAPVIGSMSGVSRARSDAAEDLDHCCGTPQQRLEFLLRWSARVISEAKFPAMPAVASEEPAGAPEDMACNAHTHTHMSRLAPFLLTDFSKIH